MCLTRLIGRSSQAGVLILPFGIRDRLSYPCRHSLSSSSMAVMTAHHILIWGRRLLRSFTPLPPQLSEATRIFTWVAWSCRIIFTPSYTRGDREEFFFILLYLLVLVIYKWKFLEFNFLDYMYFIINYSLMIINRYLKGNNDGM